jgi:uncharacterized protein YjiK
MSTSDFLCVCRRLSNRLVIIIMIAATSCGQIACQRTHTSSTTFPYDLSSPATIWTLAPQLIEISGITALENGRHLIAVQDEGGTLYHINKATGKLTDSLMFAGKGDFEAIACVRDTLYVAKSNGSLYMIPPGQQDTAHTVVRLSRAWEHEYDIEGMAYDAAQRRLLMVAKAQPDASRSDERDIFAYSLSDNYLLPVAVAVIRRQAFNDYFTQCGNCTGYEKLRARYGNPLEPFPFNPSEIAIHPISQHWYISAANGNLLIVMQADGKILHMHRLNKNIHLQPEGMWFDSNGDLYISNEGDETRPASLSLFKYRL